MKTLVEECRELVRSHQEKQREESLKRLIEAERKQKAEVSRLLAGFEEKVRSAASRGERRIDLLEEGRQIPEGCSIERNRMVVPLSSTWGMVSRELNALGFKVLGRVRERYPIDCDEGPHPQEYFALEVSW